MHSLQRMNNCQNQNELHFQLRIMNAFPSSQSYDCFARLYSKPDHFLTTEKIMVYYQFLRNKTIEMNPFQKQWFAVEVVKALVTLRLSSQLEYRKYLSFSISNKYLCIGLKRKTVKLSLMILKSFYFRIKKQKCQKI